MTMNEKPETIPIQFWRQLAGDTDLVCSLCHHFQELSAQGITGKMPMCLLEALYHHCKTGADSNNSEQTLGVTALPPGSLAEGAD
jgi:hypothetical protein